MSNAAKWTGHDRESDKIIGTDPYLLCALEQFT